MTTPSLLSAIDTTVQELRLEQERDAFIHKLAAIVSAIGTIPDSLPSRFTPDDMARLRALADETVEAIERRIDTGRDEEAARQRLAGTVYEFLKRMEAVELWFRRSEPRT